MKNKNYRRDMDLIYEDLQGKRPGLPPKEERDLDLPGLGQFYCTHCARHCINRAAYKDHVESRPHKRRVKTLEKEKPYDHKEAERLNI